MPPTTSTPSGRNTTDDRKRVLIATVLRAIIMILRAIDAYFQTGVYGKRDKHD